MIIPAILKIHEDILTFIKQRYLTMGIFGKWLGGGLGFVMGGPIGGLLGFLVGSMIDNTTVQSSALLNKECQNKPGRFRNEPAGSCSCCNEG